MDKKELFGVFSAYPAHVRDVLLRRFSDQFSVSDLSDLRSLLRHENDHYVIASLQRIINRVDNQGHNERSKPKTSGDISVNEIKSEAINWFAGVIEHEMSSIIGLLSRSLREEVDDHQSSKSRKHLSTLTEIMEAISAFRKVTYAPNFKKIDLHRCVQQIIEREFGAYMSCIEFHGPPTFLVNVDASLLAIIINNTVKNAFQCYEKSEPHTGFVLVISWGKTDTDYWVTLIDNGPGLSSELVNPFELGVSTKESGRGFGLAIVKQAASRLGGFVSLENNQPKGATFTLEWPLNQ